MALTSGQRWNWQSRSGVNAVRSKKNAVDLLCDIVCACMKKVFLLDVHEDNNEEPGANFQQELDSWSNTSRRICDAVESGDEFVAIFRNDLRISDGTPIDRSLSKVTQMGDLLETVRQLVQESWRQWFCLLWKRCLSQSQRADQSNFIVNALDHMPRTEDLLFTESFSDDNGSCHKNFVSSYFPWNNQCSSLGNWDLFRLCPPPPPA